MLDILIVGPIEDDVRLSSSFDLIIAIDKGIVKAKEKGYHVDIAIGDFDSINQEERLLLDDVEEVIELNKDKDDSDFEHCLFYLNENYKDAKITAIGFLNGPRLDHLICNILALNKYKNLDIVLKSKKSEIFILNKGNYYLEKTNFKYISFFSLSSCLITLGDGFKYKVSNNIINKTDLKYLSNEIIKDSGFISIDNDIFVVRSND